MLTLRHSDCHVVVHPARCRKCGFVFSREHLHKPGKCPRCKGTWIAEPMVEVVHV
jgi:predicted Zn-ribbon and HTH transcriptional regulator